jgi:hypothetical protein
MLKASLDTFNLEYDFMTELLMNALVKKDTAQ